MTDKFVLPEEFREELRKPFGSIIKKASELPDETRRIICVGDFVTITLLDAGLRPFLSIVDSKMERESRPDIKKRIEEADGGTKKIRVPNRPGTISEELWKSLEEAIGGWDRIRIEVDGEEDLAALAAIFLSGPGELVVYGQPGVGMVVVKPEGVKSRVRKILEVMV